jgi:hypothetical protein
MPGVYWLAKELLASQEVSFRQLTTFVPGTFAKCFMYYCCEENSWLFFQRRVTHNSIGHIVTPIVDPLCAESFQFLILGSLFCCISPFFSPNEALSMRFNNQNFLSSIKMIQQFSQTHHFLLCMMLHVSVLTWPSSGLLMNQVNNCWLHVGIPTMFTFSLGIFHLVDKYIKFKG